MTNKGFKAVDRIDVRRRREDLTSITRGGIYKEKIKERLPKVRDVRNHSYQRDQRSKSSGVWFFPRLTATCRFSHDILCIVTVSPGFLPTQNRILCMVRSRGKIYDTCSLFLYSVHSTSNDVHWTL